MVYAIIFSKDFKMLKVKIESLSNHVCTTNPNLSNKFLKCFIILIALVLLTSRTSNNLVNA